MTISIRIEASALKEIQPKDVLELLREFEKTGRNRHGLDSETLNHYRIIIDFDGEPMQAHIVTDRIKSPVFSNVKPARVALFKVDEFRLDKAVVQRKRLVEAESYYI